MRMHIRRSTQEYSHGFLQELHVGLLLLLKSVCYLYKKWNTKGDWSRNVMLNISSVAGVNFILHKPLMVLVNLL